MLATDSVCKESDRTAHTKSLRVFPAVNMKLKSARTPFPWVARPHSVLDQPVLRKPLKSTRFPLHSSLKPRAQLRLANRPRCGTQLYGTAKACLLLPLHAIAGNPPSTLNHDREVSRQHWLRFQSGGSRPPFFRKGRRSSQSVSGEVADSLIKPVFLSHAAHPTHAEHGMITKDMRNCQALVHFLAGNLLS